MTVPISAELSGETVHTDVTLWKFSAGRGGGETPRLLLIHGFRGDHHGMQLIADALEEYQVLVPDLPGYGQSPPARTESGQRVEHTVEVYAGVVEALAEKLRLGRGDVLLGHSFGTIVCAAHAAWHRRPWAKLVLSAPISDDIFAGTLLPGAAVVELYYRLSQLLPESAGNALLRSRAVLELMNLSLGVGWGPQLSAFAKDQHRQFFGRYSDRQTLLESYYASSRNTVLDYAQDIALPTLLAAGAKDTMSTAEGLRTLRDALPDGHLEVIRGAGHLVHYEKPAQLARAVRRFLREP